MATTKVDLGELVAKAEAIISDCFSSEIGSDRNDKLDSTGRTQVSNAIDAINQAQGSVEVFVNWLRYQMAREKSKDSSSEKFWTKPGKKGSLGEQVYKYADELRKRDPDHAAQYLTYFLGFMRRTLVAVNYLDKIPAQLRGGDPS